MESSYRLGVEICIDTERTGTKNLAKGEKCAKYVHTVGYRGRRRVYSARDTCENVCGETQQGRDGVSVD